MKTSPELQKAVTEYQKGSIEAFNIIYEQSYKYLHTCVIHVVKNEDMAMDMLQETYLEISKSISQLKSTEDFLSWAAMIANRKCFAHLKKQKDVLLDGSGFGDSDAEDNVTDYFENIADNEEFIPETVLQDREKQRLIKEIIDGLNDMQCLCVIGFYYNEQKQEEIAEELGIPVNTVKSHLNRAKAKIKEAVVELDVKKGTRLYSFAPFMLLFFAEEAKACEYAAMSQELRNSLALPGNTETTATFGKSIWSVAKGKVILTIGAIVIGTIAVIGVKSASDKNAEMVVEENTSIEEMSVESVSPDETNAVETESLIEENIDIEDIQDSIVSEAIISDTVAISGEYDSYGIGNAGLIPVGKRGKFGLVTYDNEIIVPLEYEYACLTANDEGYSFFGNEGNYYVFDKTGKELFATHKQIRAINDGVVFAKDGNQYNTSYAYYSLDGTVLYEFESEYEFEKDATGFSEGYAYCMAGDVVRISKDGNIENMSEFLPENQQKESQNNNSNVYVNSTSYSFRMDIPTGSLKEGYYLTKGDNISPDSYGKFYLISKDEQEQYMWDISSVYQLEGFDVSSYKWDLSYFHDEGGFYYNYGTIICPIYKNYEDKYYYLIDASKLGEASWEEAGLEWSDDAYVQFDFTPITEEALLAKADYIGMNNEKNWLIRNGEQWGYIDHAGNNMGMFDEATEFYDEKAMIMENGRAYLIDQDFNRLKDYGEVWGIENKGELFQFRTKEGYYIIKP